MTDEYPPFSGSAGESPQEQQSPAQPAPAV